MSLYHAYRPQTFADIVGQDHIKQTLAASVARGEVAHAYLFSGPRGIGKTSIARILAMAVNCSHREQLGKAQGVRGKAKPTPHASRLPERQAGLTPHQSAEPCGDCSSCLAVRGGNDLNVIEIDAASNRGIDEIRQLKETIGFAPSQQARKVYIIDEVHMLTKEAFNALLKTLEEPPAHAIFILATTELHRVPDTIISRTQHFTFKRATLADTRTHLGMIAGKEGLTLSPEATDLIALQADGAFRDALSLLDQLAALGEKEITAEHVRLLLGIAPEAELLALLTASLTSDAAGLHAALERFLEHGYDPAALSDALITALRHVLWTAYGVPGAGGSELLADFVQTQAKQQSPASVVSTINRLIVAKQQLRWSPLPMLPLELALLPSQDSGFRIQASGVTAPAVIASPRPQAETKSPPQGDPANGAGQSGEVPAAQTDTKNPPQSPFAKGEEQGSPSLGKEGLGEISTVPSGGKEKIPKQVQDDPPSPQASEGRSKNQKLNVEIGDLGAVWTKVLSAVRPKNAQLAALLKSSKLLLIADGTCQIEVPFSFYADRIKDRKNAGIITAAIEAETGVVTIVRCSVAGTTEVSGIRHQSSDGQPLTPHPSPLTGRTQDDVAKDVMEVFGVSEPVTAPATEEVTGG